MSESTIAFNAVRQFVIMPDRYYRVELHAGVLKFIKTGSQFDQNHPGSAGRHSMQADASQEATEQSEGIEFSKSTLILGGIGIVVVSLALMFLAARWGWIIFPLATLTALGFIAIMAGLATPSKHELETRPYDFDLPLAHIASAMLHLPQRAGRVARLEIQPQNEKLIKLTINTQRDLQIVQGTLLPLLGPRAGVA